MWPRLSREQSIIAGSLLTIALASWWYTFTQSTTMMMDSTAYQLDLVGLTLFASSWSVGMVAMMFPTVVPMMLLFFHVGRTSRQEVRAGGGPNLTKASLFIGTYIAIWIGVGAIFYVALAAASGFLSLDWFFNTLMSPIGVGASMVIVGIYQLSPIKSTCLDRCHPTSFLFKYYRGGATGAAKMGLLYAKYCVGCCWVMMLFLLLIGAMGAFWMALFAALIFAERVIVHRNWPSRIIGSLFLLAGLVSFFIM